MGVYCTFSEDHEQPKVERISSGLWKVPGRNLP